MESLTKNFSLTEFTCHDGTEVPDELKPNVKELAENLQVLRDELKEPIRITSGYRTPAWNKKIGGEKNSYHMKAMAADIVVSSKTPKQLAAIIERLIKEGRMKQGGLGVYPSWIHYDVRGVKARW
jgi:uncharacterized protein YcbK (DUF882 family)